jgi:CheY-like chemotaxis protein
VSLPHLLLVDDSEAILAYERAALAGHYTISTASNGEEGLKKARELLPAAMLLDLSMPQMSGDEVLVKLKADPYLKDIPVIIVSSEKQRAEACLQIGAIAFLPKPIRAEDLRVLVGQVLETTRQHQRRGSLAILTVRAGPHEMAFPLESVRAVIDQPLTRALPMGPSYLCEMFDLHGEPICILDLNKRLGAPHSVSVTDRKLVVLSHQNMTLAICVDQVRDPEELPAEEVLRKEQIGGGDHGPLTEVLLALVKTSRGTVPVIDPAALLAKALLREIPNVLRELANRATAA